MKQKFSEKALIKGICLSYIALSISLSTAPSNASNIPYKLGFTSDTPQQIKDNAQKLNPNVLALGVQAYHKALGQGLDKQGILTIVDYSKPSTERRLWVIDMKNNRVLFNEFVAHGQNSGDNQPTRFSDSPQSLESSLGVYVTGNTYTGKHGYSLRVIGLEKGVNDKAEARDIVFHAAPYVTQAFASLHGRLGRSWGCFALNPQIASNVIQTIKNGTLVFAYYPDHAWLSHSRFLA